MEHSTKDGELPPFEIAKAVAYNKVLQDITSNLGCPAHELIGQRVDEYIAQRISLKGGGHPTARAVRALVRHMIEVIKHIDVKT